jgi:ABC-type Mn2+/Zn2+ transport system ATPase subunit
VRDHLLLLAPGAGEGGAVDAALSRTGIADMADRHVTSLSLGQARRAALAGVLVRPGTS